MGEDSNLSQTSSSVPEGSGTKFVQNVSYNFFDLANAAGKFSRTPQSKSALDNFFEKLKYLEKEWYEFGVKYEQISRRNERLVIEYERERHKAKVYQKRLKFVRENQENFERLREVYDSIKNLEGHSVVEQEVQTEAEDTVSVNKDTLKSAKDTLNTIKDMVGKRETRYDDNNKKLAILTERVEILETQNTQLTQLLRHKCAEEDNRRLKEESDGQEKSLNKPKVASETSRFKSRLKVIEIPVDDMNDEGYTESDIDFPLKAIKSMKSSLTSTLSKVRSSDYGLPLTTSECMTKRRSRTYGKGDCKEVEVLKKIRVEIEKKQQSIKKKIDIFNTLLKE